MFSQSTTQDWRMLMFYGNEPDYQIYPLGYIPKLVDLSETYSEWPFISALNLSFDLDVPF